MGFSCSSGTGFTFVSGVAAGGGGAGAVAVTLGGAPLKGVSNTGFGFGVALLVGNLVAGSSEGSGDKTACCGKAGGAGLLSFSALGAGMFCLRRLRLEPVEDPKGLKNKNAVGKEPAGIPDSTLIPAAFPVANGFRGETMFASLLKCFHCSAVKLPLVKMSAICCLVLT